MPWVLLLMSFIATDRDRIHDQGDPFTMMPQADQPRAATDAQQPVEIHYVLTGESASFQVIEVILLETSSRAIPAWRTVRRSFVQPAHGMFSVVGNAGEVSLLVIRPVSGAWYSLEGPFTWPHQSDSRHIRLRHLRTLAGKLPHGSSTPAELMWLQIDDGSSVTTIPCTLMGESSWECVGVPVNASGVVVAISHDGLSFRVISRSDLDDRTAQPMDRAAWARLVSVSSPRRDDPAVELSIWRTETSRGFGRQLREPDPTTGTIRLDAAHFWIYGRSTPSDRFLQIAGPGFATARLDLGEVASGPLSAPAVVQLTESTPVLGVVLTHAGDPAPGALVLVSEIVEQPPGVDPTETRRVQRRSVMDARADSDGRFVLDGLGSQRYDLLVIHRTEGRARLSYTPDGRSLTVRLSAPRQIGGRVLWHDRPAAGIPVVLLPDPDELAASREPLDHVSLETTTGSDGRFRLSLPPAGTTELRIGTDDTGLIRRRLLPTRQMAAMTDLGDLRLGRPIRFSAYLTGSDGCDLLAAGPMGSLGMHVVRARSGPGGAFSVVLPEPGRWFFTASCSGTEWSVEPPTMNLQAETDDISVTFNVVR